MTQNNPNIPFIDLAAQQKLLRPQIEAAISKVLDSGHYIMGQEVTDLEAKLAEFTGAKHALVCSSGTSALVLAMMVLGVKKGDAVFVPTFTFIATAEAVILAGGTPVMVDVRKDTFLMDDEDLKKAILWAKEQGLTPKLVVPVDLFGLAADYDKISAIAKENGMQVVCDACQSFGAAVGNKRIGTLGAISATSFFPAKPLGCYGDGGALFTDSDENLELMKSFRVHGMGADRYENVRIGINGRLDTIQAAILLVKMTVLEDELKKRDEVATKYREGIKKAIHQHIPQGYKSAWAQYSMLVENRDKVQAALKEKGIPTMIYYPLPIHRQKAYEMFAIGREFPVSDMLSQKILSVPMHPYLDSETQGYIIDAMNSALA